MSTATAVTTQTPLPREMMEHTYPILFEVEGSHWWYVGRRKLIAYFVEKVVSQIKGRRAKIVDVGCGTGANLVLLNTLGDTEGIDVSEDALEFCRERGLENVKLGSAEDLPQADGSVDLVTAFDVIEHLDDDKAGLTEFRRVLRPDGHVLLFVPAFMFLWGVQDDVSNHRRRYTMAELIKVVEESGFEVERTTYANMFFFAPVFLVRKFLKLSGIRPETENSIGISAFNGIFGKLFGFEAKMLEKMNLPFGVSAICLARRVD